MIRFRLSESSSPALLGGLLLYLLLIVLVLVLSNGIVSGFGESESPSNAMILVLGAVFGVLLLSFIAVNVLRLLLDRARGKPAAPFKLRVMLFFLAVTLLSAVPHAILSVSMISTVLNSAVFDRLADTVDGGLRTALDYDGFRVYSLGRYARSSHYAGVVRRLWFGETDAWAEVTQVNPGVDAVQLFDEGAVERAHFGSSTARAGRGDVESRPDGLLPRETLGDGTVVIRHKRSFSVGEDRVIALTSAVLPPYFSANAERLTSVQAMLSRAVSFRGYVFLLTIVVYGLFSLPLILIALLISFIMSDELIRPVVALEEATRRVAEGDFSIRILSRSEDSLTTLVSSFNSMVSELERSRSQSLQTEKVVAWQEIAQRLAHEIKNPLTPIKLSAERIQKKYADGDPDFGKVVKTATESIIAEVAGLDRLIGEFRSFSRLPEPHLAAIRLAPLLAEVSAAYSAAGAPVRVDVAGVSPEVEVVADSGQLRQVFANLVANAVEAMPGGGQVHIRSDLVRRGNLSYCRVQVRDSGVGIPPEHRVHVFNPYFTTKENGTGLGLAIAERIVSDHNGQIWFESQPGVGSVFYVDLPMDRVQ